MKLLAMKKIQCGVVIKVWAVEGQRLTNILVNWGFFCQNINYYWANFQKFPSKGISWRLWLNTGIKQKKINQIFKDSKENAWVKFWFQFCGQIVQAPLIISTYVLCKCTATTGTLAVASLRQYKNCVTLDHFFGMGKCS